jgi:hypothetical protein
MPLDHDAQQKVWLRAKKIVEKISVARDELQELLTQYQEVVDIADEVVLDLEDCLEKLRRLP